MNTRAGVLLCALPGLLAAQTMVETGMGTGRAGNSAAAAANAGKSIGGAFHSLSRTLDPEEAKSGSAKKGAVRRASRSARTAPARLQNAASKQAEYSDAAGKAEAKFEDPSGIATGMEYVELVRRFGAPSLKLTTGPGEETLSYAMKDASGRPSSKRSRTPSCR